MYFSCPKMNFLEVFSKMRGHKVKKNILEKLIVMRFFLELVSHHLSLKCKTITFAKHSL